MDVSYHLNRLILKVLAGDYSGNIHFPRSLFLFLIGLPQQIPFRAAVPRGSD